MKRRWGSSLGVGVIGIIVACSSSPNNSSTPPASENDPGATAGAQVMASLQQSVTVADSIFQFDPDLVPRDSAEKNANTMELRSKTSIAGCPGATVQLTLTKLSIDFGPPPGCALATGGTVSGALEASISGGGGADLGTPRPLTVAMRFTKLDANGIALDGAITFTTSTAGGETFDVTISSLTTNVGTINGTMKVTGTPQSIGLDGDLSVNVTGLGTASVNVAGVTVKPTDCYPSAGAQTITVLGIKTVSTYDAGTASSGKYTKQTGERKPEAAFLAPYGNCPPGPPGPGATR